MPREYTYQDVAEHNTKTDCFLVVHNKVYDVSNFIDEHPGGEEVMLDVGGQDATEAFEDVGHSDEARETLDKLYAGDLKRTPGDPSPKKPAQGATAPAAQTQTAGLGIVFYIILVVGAGAAYLAYNYMQREEVVDSAP